MSATSRALAAPALLLALLAWVVPAAAEPATDPAPGDRPVFSSVDNRVTVSRIFGATGAGHWSRRPDGSIDGTTTKQAYSFTHTDTWAYGANYVDVTLYKSGSNDPAAPCLRDGVRPGQPPGSHCRGETEIYLIVRSTLSWNEVFDSEAFSRPPLKNISFLAGVDANHQNDFNGGFKRAVVAGLKLDFELPYQGALSLAPMTYYEFDNRSRFLRCTPPNSLPGVTCTPGGRKHFKPAWSLETSYHLPLAFLGSDASDFSLSGRLNFRGPKGNQNAPLGRASGGKPTTTEINSEPVRLTFDAGKAFGGPTHSHDVDVWIAYRYWKNKFGLDASASPTCFTGPSGQSNKSCTESSVVTGITVKL